MLDLMRFVWLAIYSLFFLVACYIGYYGMMPGVVGVWAPSSFAGRLLQFGFFFSASILIIWSARRKGVRFRSPSLFRAVPYPSSEDPFQFLFVFTLIAIGFCLGSGLAPPGSGDYGHNVMVADITVLIAILTAQLVGYALYRSRT
jgi:hypothetical protein